METIKENNQPFPNFDWKKLHTMHILLTRLTSNMPLCLAGKRILPQLQLAKKRDIVWDTDLIYSL